MAYDQEIGTADRYYGAIDSYKRQNAAKGKLRVWVEQVADAQAIVDFVQYQDGGFLGNMNEAIRNYGSLTDGQANAVRKIMADQDQRNAKWAAERAAEAAASDWVGVVGERMAFEVTVQHVISFETEFGYTHINICKDADKNVVVYKGSNAWEKGSTITCQAKVKEHGEREGVKQTIIQRPTKIQIN